MTICLLFAEIKHRRLRTIKSMEEPPGRRGKDIQVIVGGIKVYGLKKIIGIV